MAYILALDQGTTSSRALIINSTGVVVAVAKKEFKQFFPEPGLVEHDPEEIWSSQIAVAHEVLAKANLKSTDIAAIGITNQRETTILWDKKTSKPIYKAIVWQDRRTTPLCKELKKHEPLFVEKTGLVLDPYFSATKIRWILDHMEGKYKIEDLAFGTVDSWLCWKLSNGNLHITDATNASRTLLYNIHTKSWDDELLDIFKIPRSILPEVKSSSEVYGKTGEHLFSNPIPIAAIAGDQQAALFGQGCFEKGSGKATYGTGCFILMNTGKDPVISKKKLLTTIAIQINQEAIYALEGSVFIAGAAVQWLRDNLGVIKKSEDIEKLAMSVPDTEGVSFVPAFTGLGAPYWDPHARGAILGLTRGTTTAHIARAALESIALSAAAVLKAMQEDSKISLSELRVDGGVVISDLLMQFQSDILNTKVLRPKTKELTALGAAFLAGLAVGIWKSKEEIRSIWKLDRCFEPKMGQDERDARLHTW